MIQPCFSPGRVTGLCWAVSIGAEAWGAGGGELGARVGILSLLGPPRRFPKLELGL